MPTRPTLDLGALVAQVVDAFGVSLPADAQHPLTLERPDTPLLLDADGPRLELVLLDLLGNAAKYSAPDSPITVRLATQAGQAVITVEDQGIGIPDNAQPRLFEPFYGANNVPAQSSGCGTGLYIVRRIVERHGGHLQLQSSEAGARVWTW